MINKYSKGIYLSDYEGTWYVIDSKVTEIGELFLLEHEEYGKNIGHVIVNRYGDVLLDPVWHGFKDWEEYIKENGYDNL